jgi:AcrR family transcriptional regulator
VRRGEQTRQEIIRKAPLFNQRGYDGAALSDLMRATGLEKSGIYQHFGSKQELAGDAFDYAWRLECFKPLHIRRSYRSGLLKIGSRYRTDPMQWVAV